MFGMNTTKTVQVLDSTVDFSAVRSVLSNDDRPILAGKIVVTFDRRSDGLTKVVTANMVDDKLVDLEGECEETDPVYAVVARWASFIIGAIWHELGDPTYAEAMGT